ncbi:MAG: transposase [Bacteroidaceae bacterium]|nr:transposase [Bacteroidaceae bacterium]MBQ9170081.1 transposase [Bacteroidaceae bacterium]MBQ9294939.1 transposase [Bacteroidaceae bacterium]
MPALTRNIYFTTSTVVDWMDVFTRPLYKHIMVDSLKYCQANKGLDVYAWVLMSNHLHMIVGTEEGVAIGDMLRDFKKFTSKSIIKAIMENIQESRKDWLIGRFGFRAANDKKITGFKFWQDGNHIEQIDSYEFFRQKLEYIHHNPVKQEIVERPEDYLYSSARNYAGLDGLLNVIVVR